MEKIQKKLLEVLSCCRFLTLHEITNIIKTESTTCLIALKELEQQQLILLKHFAGRDYFLTNQSLETIGLGHKAETYLSSRPSSKKIGYARTCYHHLAGKVGVQLMQQLIEMKYLITSDGINYELTKSGQDFLSAFLEKTITEKKVSTCIDFSERLPHLSGKLGECILNKLVSNNQITMSQDRMIKVNTVLTKIFL